MRTDVEIRNLIHDQVWRQVWRQVYWQILEQVSWQISDQVSWQVSRQVQEQVSRQADALEKKMAIVSFAKADDMDGKFIKELPESIEKMPAERILIMPHLIGG